MHPILSHRGRLGAYLAALVPLCAVLTGLLARPGAFSLSEAVALAVPLTVVYAFLALSAWYACRSLPIERGKVGRLLATHAFAALVTSAVWVLMGALISRLLGFLPLFAALPPRYGPQVPVLLAAGMLLHALSVALHYVFLSLEAAREAERREAELKLLAREAELTALKAQIQPHFLFNCLNSIHSLIGAEPVRAREMCLSLADFLRKSLAVGGRRSIRLGEELSLAKSYLDVERIRFGDRLVVEEDVESQGEDCLIPPLLLQPLVENAVVHGISTLVHGGVVRLEARRAGHRLRIVVENPFDPEAPARPRGGMGFRIIRERLDALYGGDAIFAAKRLEGKYLAVISLPARAPARAQA